MQELWTEADEAALAAFVNAARRGAVFPALLAIEDADAEAQHRAQDTVIQLAARVEAIGGEPGEALRRALGQERGLHSPASVDPVRGSHPTTVLRDGQGLPLTISAIWIEVARRAGVRVRGVGLPGYFVARLLTPKGQRLVDPGQGGVALSEADCRVLVTSLFGDRVPWRPEFLRAVTPAAMLTRALNNLLNAYANADDAAGRYRVVRFLCALHPRTAAVHLLHARVAEELGAVRLAGALYEQVAERFPNSAAAATAARERSAIGELPLLH